MSKRMIGSGITVAIAASVLAGIGIGLMSQSDTAQSRQLQRTACRQALQARIDAALSSGAVPSAARPPACVGLSDAELAQVVEDLMNPPSPTSLSTTDGK